MATEEASYYPFCLRSLCISNNSPIQVLLPNNVTHALFGRYKETFILILMKIKNIYIYLGLVLKKSDESYFGISYIYTNTSGYIKKYK